MSEADTELLAAIERVVEALESLGVDYFIGGSVASAVFGEPRQTVDADLIARLFMHHAAHLGEKLNHEFYVDLSSIHNAIQFQSSFNLIHLQTMTKVDVFVRWRDAFGQAQFARRQKKRVGTALQELFFASAEDTVLAKLEWFRKGGEISDRQWRDIVGVLKIQSDLLDRDYLSRWADELGVAGLLRRALDEAGLPSGD